MWDQFEYHNIDNFTIGHTGAMLGIASAMEDIAAAIQTTKPILSGKFYKNFRVVSLTNVRSIWLLLVILKYFI